VLREERSGNAFLMDSCLSLDKTWYFFDKKQGFVLLFCTACITFAYY
jgi:hypothetical protein